MFLCFRKIKLKREEKSDNEKFELEKIEPFE